MTNISDIFEHKVKKIINSSHGDTLKVELIVEFARRLGGFLGAGLTPKMAVIAIKKHYKEVGKMMIEIADDTEIIEEIESIASDLKEPSSGGSDHG